MLFKIFATLMQSEKGNKTKLKDKLKHKYRLVLLNDDTFEERLSWQLTPLNVFTYVGLVLIALIVALTSLIAFTPLREYIPGYSDIETKRNAAYAVFKSDSLEAELATRDMYITNVRRILSGEPLNDTIEGEINPDQSYDNIEDSRSDADSAFRAKIEDEEEYTINQNLKGNQTKSTYFFFTPIKGVVSSSFDADDRHYGVDVVADENEAIKAVMDGTVTMADWTTESGYVIQIQHRNNLVSNYKHCSVLLKKPGDAVEAGEAIAIVGNSGEHTTGPHLHFELWEDGQAVNPELYIVF